MTTPASNPSTDSPLADPALEANLRALTTYAGEPTALWRDALDQHAARRVAPRSRLKLAITLISAAAIIVLAVGIMLPSFESVHLGRRFSVGSVAIESADSLFAPDASTHARDLGQGEWNETRARTAPSQYAAKSVPGDETLSERAKLDSSRSVIRKATLELAVPDARDTFAKCQHLLRLDLGEFVEGSTLTGQGNEARAQLTLRVAASRMDEVLNSLRTLGKIDSENATGDDVSAQVVDLDARLRNERQVECEVLKLLESRKDAQLKDILELRDKLSSIRASIEQLQGRRDTLGRQISLASILVLIRPDSSEKPVAKPSSLFDGFSNEMSNAWTGGVSALTQTIAFLIRIMVGGLIWWLLLAGAIAIARRAIHRWIPDPAAVPRAI